MPKSIQVIPIQKRYTYRDLLDLPPLLKIEEAAEILGTSGHNVRNRCIRGDLDAVKVGSIWRVNTLSLLLMTGLYEDVESIRTIEDGHREAERAERHSVVRTAAWLA